MDSGSDLRLSSSKKAILFKANLTTLFIDESAIFCIKTSVASKHQHDTLPRVKPPRVKHNAANIYLSPIQCLSIVYQYISASLMLLCTVNNSFLLYSIKRIWWESKLLQIDLAMDSIWTIIMFRHPRPPPSPSVLVQGSATVYSQKILLENCWLGLYYRKLWALDPLTLCWIDFIRINISSDRHRVYTRPMLSARIWERLSEQN